MLCEKPFTANAAEAEQVAAVADETPLVVMEAFHYRYHPVAEKMREIAQSGELGELRRIETSMCIPLPLPKDIRYRYDLGGGAVMDVGCYAIHMNRLVAGLEPRVVSAKAKTIKPNIDRWMRAELRYPNGLSGTMTCALLSSTLLKIGVKVTGDLGTLTVFNPTGPQMGYRMTVRTNGTKRRVKVEGAKKPTYKYQLEAFTNAVLQRRAGADPACRLDRQHARRRRDLRSGRASGPGDVMDNRQIGTYIARGRVGLGLAILIAPGAEPGDHARIAVRTTRAHGRSAASRGSATRSSAPADRSPSVSGPVVATGSR